MSSSSAWAHGVITGDHAVHVCYCHNPFRYAWNAREQAARGTPRTVPRAALSASVPPLARVGLDRRPARRPLRGELARRRRRAIGHYFGRDATVLYPPVQTERFAPGRRATHYVVLSELMAHKRMDLAVQAFNRA